MALFDFLRVAEYKETIKSHETEISAQKETIEAQSAEIAAQKEAIDNLEANASEYEKTLQAQNEEISALKKRIEELEAAFTDEHQQILDTKSLLEKLESKKKLLEIEISDKQHELSALQINIDVFRENVAELKENIVELEETVLLQDFGLYQPTYDFATSNQYKEKLDKCRTEQKRMIKNGTAAICNTSWTVNGSLRKGQKMTKDNTKQALITFNTECEYVISKVKFNNFDSMKKRIEKLYEKLNKLNAVNEIEISIFYLHLKLDELTLAYEYARKKQEEKEYAREQREIQRENAKVQKELEAERRRIEKEQIHYENELKRLTEQQDAETSAARKELIAEKITAVEAELEDLDKALKDVDYRQANERVGHVYIISNIGAFGEGVYKIGMTRRPKPMDRIAELGGASVPFKFDVHAMIFSNDAPKLETALHNAFADKRVNKVNSRKEFYRVSLDEIKAVVLAKYDKTVDFTELPIAEQYRESLKFIGN